MEPNISIDCPSCNTKYRLRLPNKLVENPNKPMSFKCNNCGHKFQIEPQSILEQPEVAETMILVKKEDELNIFKQQYALENEIDNKNFESDDMVKHFGEEWTKLGDHLTYKHFFESKDNPSSKSDSSEASKNTQDNSKTEVIIKNLKYFLKRSGIEKELQIPDNSDKALRIIQKHYKKNKDIYDMIAKYIAQELKSQSLEESLKPIIEKMLKEHYNY